MYMKKVCVVTAARSEYGLLRWIIDEIYHAKDLELQLIVSGSHLSPEQGLTYKQIEEDGYPINRKIEFLLSSVSSIGIAKSMGICGISIADAFSELKPDILVVLGDRYELLPICNAALTMGIPIAHISGGDITEGAIDNQVRNAITMLATLHFPGTTESALNIQRMLGSNKHIYNVGEPGLETFVRTSLIKKAEIAEFIGINQNKKWILMTLHPETYCSIEDNLKMANDTMSALESIKDVEVIVTAANADLGGNEMNDIYRVSASKNNHIHFIHSLGHLRYLSTMSQSWCLIGNTSSGIVEAPFLGIPVINIGNRQKGRYICNNVINIPNEQCALIKDILLNLPSKFQPNYYFGDGNTAYKIVTAIRDFLN